MVSEVNTVSVKYTSVESDVNIQYKAFADWPVLGRRLRGAMPKVKAALAELSSEEVKAFRTSGSIEIAGQTLTTGDLTVVAEADFSASTDFVAGAGDKTAAKEDGELIVVLDIRSSPELVMKGLARGFISSCQQLRKKAALQATDDVDIFYTGCAEQMVEAIGQSKEAIWRELGSSAVEDSQRPEGKKVLAEEEIQVADHTFQIKLVARDA